MGAVTNLGDLLNRVSQRIVRVTGGETHPERGAVENVLEGALLKLSRASPRVTTKTFSGDGSTYDFTLSGSPAWVAGFSTVVAVEYPAGEQDPVYVDPNEWMLYPDIAAPTHLRFRFTSPSSGTNNVKLLHTLPHTVDSTSSTMNLPQSVAAEHFGVCALAKVYAARYGHTTDPTIEADSADYRSKADEWRRLADSECAAGYAALGVPVPSGGAGAGSGGGSSGGVGAPGGSAGMFAEVDPGVDGLVWRDKGRR